MKTIQKRATIYLDSELHRALRIQAAESDRTISDLVNEAVRLKLSEDAEDLSAFEERVHEPNLRFEDALKDLKKRGKI
ncbi:MAG: CopG family transcriptional regulator [Syntrophobacteraceae bacterium]